MPISFISSYLPIFITGGQLMWYILLALLAFFGAYAFILVYHWLRYGMNLIVSLLATILYLSVSGGLFLIMFFSIGSFIA